MNEIITATFVDGAFVPEQMLALPPGTRVQLTIEPADSSNSPSDLPNTNTSQVADTSFYQACQDTKLKSGRRLTRDQLHERD